jgi:DNA helicase II / ATP-dependent DNA helicase PcrA
MSSPVKLSKNQQSIVFAASGALYVKASPGSGKTRVLTERVRHLLPQTNKKILVLTFTNKAGQEIKNRLSDLEDVDGKTFIGTFHGFCQSVLENHSNLIGYATMPHIFEDEGDRLELIAHAIKQVPSYLLKYEKYGIKKQRELSYKMLNLISSAKRELISDIASQTDDEGFILLYSSYQDILRSQNVIDFDDLLLKTYTLFIDFPKVAALYRRSFFAICIDEAQDMNNAQYQLLKALSNGEFNNIMLVGDPNQSIFHFNGSSQDYMDKEFIKDFNPKVIELTEDYRSSIAVLKAAIRIIPKAKFIEKTVKQGKFECYRAENEDVEAQWIADKIRAIIELGQHDDIEGELCFEKIVVLARNKYLFKPLEEKFKSKNIHFYYKMTPGALKFESSLMKIFDLAFRVKLNPQDDLHSKRLLIAVDVDISDGRQLPKLVNAIQDSAKKTMVQLVIALDDEGNNFKKKLEDYQHQVSIVDEAERSMLFRDIEELVTHWHNYAKGTDNKSLNQFKNAMALGRTHPLTQHSGVTLSTVHTIKGQEFDIVFVIGMDDETFPDYRAVHSGGIELTQERNNLYIAFTRSKRWLFVTWPEKRTMPWGGVRGRKISRFLEDFQCDGIPNCVSGTIL